MTTKHHSVNDAREALGADEEISDWLVAVVVVLAAAVHPVCDTTETLGGWLWFHYQSGTESAATLSDFCSCYDDSAMSDPSLCARRPAERTKALIRCDCTGGDKIVSSLRETGALDGGRRGKLIKTTGPSSPPKI